MCHILPERGGGKYGYAINPNWIKHDSSTLIDWCTGREWPVNCMTVISVCWRSNMPFQRLSGRLNYYITRWDRKSVSWRSDELETRCGRGSQHPERLAPRPPGAASGEQERHNADGHMSGGQYIAALFGLQLPPTVKPWVTLFEPFNKVRSIFF